MAECIKNMKGVSKSKPKKPNYSDETLRKALQDIREDKESIRSACRKYGIPRSTIQDRLHCRVTDGPRRMGPAPVLGDDGENKLSHYIIEMAKRGFPLNKKVLLKTVENIVKETGKKNTFKDGVPGQKWLKSFLKRHPEISLRVPENISKDRALVTEAAIRKWFKNLREYLSEINASDILNDADRVLNGDESGFSLCPKTGKVLAPKGYKNVYEVKISKEKENITVLIIFTASGKICPPLVIFPYVRPPRPIVNSMPKEWVLGRSESGWMRGDIFYEYISNDFNKWLIEKKIKKPVLLLVDGHKSHMTLPLSEFCESNGIILYTLPPRTTHMLQPADVSVFKPLKQGWKNTVREFHSESEDLWNSAVTKTNFCPLFEKALNAFDMPQQIINGFRKCGLFPLNEEAVDYTKCVKDNANPRNQRSSTGITSAEIDIAIKVIQAANLDSKHGIDTGLILKELNNMKSKTGQRKSTPKRKSSQKPTPKSTPKRKSSQKCTPTSSNLPDKNVPLPILETPKVGSYVSLDDISVMPLDLCDSQLMITSNILTESDIAFTNCTNLGANINLMRTSHDSDITNASELSDNLLNNEKCFSALDICIQDIQTQEMAKNIQKSIDSAYCLNESTSCCKTNFTQLKDIPDYPEPLDVIQMTEEMVKTIQTSLDTAHCSNNSTSRCETLVAPLTDTNREPLDVIQITEEMTKNIQTPLDTEQCSKNSASGCETLGTQQTDTQERREPLDVIQMNDPFTKHLIFPKPASPKPGVQKKRKAIIPNAISSEAWRKHYELKEEEKKEKEEAITRRKLIRKEAKENKEKEKSKRTKNKKYKSEIKKCKETDQQNTKPNKAIKKNKTKTTCKKNCQDSDDPDDYCTICGESYYNKEGPNVEWIQCVRCHKWLHITCSTNPDLCPKCIN